MNRRILYNRASVDKNGKPFTAKALRNLVRHGNLMTIDKGLIGKDSLDAFIGSRKKEMGTSEKPKTFAKPPAAPAAPAAPSAASSLGMDEMPESFTTSLKVNFKAEDEELLDDEVDNVEDFAKEASDLTGTEITPPAEKKIAFSEIPTEAPAPAAEASPRAEHDYFAGLPGRMKSRYMEALEEVESTPGVGAEIERLAAEGLNEEDIRRRLYDSKIFPGATTAHIKSFALSRGLTLVKTREVAVRLVQPT
jgi:hypothetical protein